MADTQKSTDGPGPFDADAWNPLNLPDFENDFVDEDDFDEFAKALTAPDMSPSEEDLLNPKQPTEFITALNDWKPVHQRVRGRPSDKRKGKTRKPPRRGKDETREGWTYKLLKWPLLLGVAGWIIGLGMTYLLTRVYIYLYEQTVTWRGRRQKLRAGMRSKTNYQDWVAAANELDDYLGNDKWKATDEYAYYDCKTIRRVTEQLRKYRLRVDNVDARVDEKQGPGHQRAIDDLRGLAEACIKNNFAGYENPRLYSETYYGTKNLVQAYVDEAAAALDTLFTSPKLSLEDKRSLAKHLSTNFGRTALCLSGGATFAYYHFGIAKALLDADLLPSIITGTSGGALVAALLATRTNDELKKLLVPALAARINACHESFKVWFKRWYATGARFDSVDWAKRCAWFCHGSLTFAEAYERTGRILNVSCVPSDPHSPTILANYLTAPDCVVWSAVLASAAVPGILNPVVLMRKRRDGKLEPFSFGHKWKDGSLRTDIPLKALNLHFNVNFSIVSQVNPHVNLFFFSSRGTVGRPVTHRRGRGWRGGFLGSALEQYLKLDLTKWLKVLRHLELLPRWMGQDWSEVWLQRFSGTITIWPKSIPSDFYHILSDPSMERLSRMIHVGQQAAFPKLNFIGNRIRIERLIDDARRATRLTPASAFPTPSAQTAEIKNVFSEEDLQQLLAQARAGGGIVDASTTSRYAANSARDRAPRLRPRRERSDDSPLSPTGRVHAAGHRRTGSLSKRIGAWFGGLGRHNSSPGTASPAWDSDTAAVYTPEQSDGGLNGSQAVHGRRTSVMDELERQSRVFFDDSTADEGETDDELRMRSGARRGMGSLSASPSGSGDERVPMEAIEERLQ
ncbi:patatin-domain-containing protein [Myriangium duriaei CBS 260.36]|uniref:Patatin-like phospholipase domain-containing protein n=1 Tax=Myriangium duriaei CBS 260.36 TaxID=1168546 RepID=A0A9P4J5T9_9PEZI|nr:patatin-domain-containing protein [Myriangium duriaei CBS 260.36]